MQGHARIIKARLDGLRPEGVTIHDRPEWVRDPDGAFPHWVYLEPHDNPFRLDLRWVFMLDITVDVRGESRMIDCFDAICLAGASRLTACARNPQTDEIVLMLVSDCKEETHEWRA